MSKVFKVAALSAIIFCICSLLTLRNYGVTWDSVNHFFRGQAYLHLFLTGKSDYSNFEGRRSFYQTDYYPSTYYLQNDVGHPPFNGIAAAFTNWILFQKLGIVEDVQAHHLFIVFSSALLVFIVVAFAYQTFGKLSAIVAFLTLVTYPLFWSESHFNIKDPPLAAFFSGTIWSFYNSLYSPHKNRWLITSIIFAALAFATKFNLIFLPLILIPYLLLHAKKLRFSRKYMTLLFLSPFIIFGFLFLIWPILWTSPIQNFLDIVRFYQDIGAGERYQPNYFYIKGFNTYPLLWILFTSPLVSILLVAIGVVVAWKYRKEAHGASLLWLLWLLVPIARVSIPGASLYGGIRQIFEFIPAFALLASIGAYYLSTVLKRFKYINLVIVGMFIFPIFTLVQWHPFENAYFNTLIGGLDGAKERNFPSWGNTFGSAYRQGADWLNANAEKNAKMTLVQGIYPNVPRVWLRSDLDFKPQNWSGLAMEGEYVMDLTFDDTAKSYYYTWDYVDRFLNPVYEAAVDNVSVLKIWKNDRDHLKSEYRNLHERLYSDQPNFEKKNDILEINLNNTVTISRIVIHFNESESCMPIQGARVEYFINNVGVVQKDGVPLEQKAFEPNLRENLIEYWSAGHTSEKIQFAFGNQNSCAFNQTKVEIYELKW